MSKIKVSKGNSPLVLGFPHTGTDIPPDCLACLNQTGRALADTDWHIHLLYADLVPDITTVRTTMHRYVIDVNRDPLGGSLYPGQNTTGLCPLTDFEGNAIYAEGREPDQAEIARRAASFHAPYHAALMDELERVKALHGFAILLDCHSIRSKITFLFEDRLPDFNIGTNLGVTCAPSIELAVQSICANADGYSSILNGRFKGGWTTRHYGQPLLGVHAIQMELAQSTYMSESPPWLYDHALAVGLRQHLSTILETLTDWRPQ